MTQINADKTGRPSLHPRPSASSAVSSTDEPPTLISIAVVSYDGRFLVGQRPSGVPLAGFWEFPGGKVQPGESSEEAALRECREEAGLNVRIVGEYPGVAHNYPHGRLQLRYFACEPLDPAASPLAPFRWVQAAALVDLPFPPANGEVLRQIASSRQRPGVRS